MGYGHWVTITVLKVLVTGVVFAKAENMTMEEEVKEVMTRDGLVRGRLAQDGDYLAFIGIPYAAPPIGNLRYKAPQPPTPWSGVLLERTAQCPQDGGGEEDCLLLHVFTPRGNCSELLPVLVNIHGGGFAISKASTVGYGPLVNEGLIIVSMNYRLGALGWLCLGTEAAPGNAGLWDQVAALRWVRDNIRAFGGDPTRVTLFGISAGATSTQILALTEAQDLFHQVVCLDGTAISVYSVMPTPLKYGRYYAKLLGYDSYNTNNITELEKFYMEVSAEAIANKSKEFFLLDSGESGFAPCVERRIEGVESLLLEPPALLLAGIDKPALVSFSNNEGTQWAEKFYEDIDRYNYDFASFVPSNLEFPEIDKNEKMKGIKQFYFGKGNVTQNNTVEYSTYWGDNQFVYPAVASVRMTTRAPTYLFEFTHVGALSVAQGLPGVSGAGHGDIKGYLFPTKKVDKDEDRRVVKEVTKILANFVYFGTPSIADWPPVSADAVCYLRVGNQTETKCDPYPERMNFWSQLYDKYRKTDYTWVNQV